MLWLIKISSAMTVTLPFPNETHFRVLLKHCEESSPDDVFFYDSSCGIEANHQQFLQDVYATRQGLLNGLPRVLFNDQDIIHEERPFICLLNQGNYEYIVAAFAVLILGGAVVPLCGCSLFSAGLFHWYIQEEDYYINGSSPKHPPGRSLAFNEAVPVRRPDGWTERLRPCQRDSAIRLEPAAGHPRPVNFYT